MKAREWFLADAERKLYIYECSDATLVVTGDESRGVEWVAEIVMGRLPKPSTQRVGRYETRVQAMAAAHVAAERNRRGSMAS